MIRRRARVEATRRRHHTSRDRRHHTSRGRHANACVRPSPGHSRRSLASTLARRTLTPAYDDRLCAETGTFPHPRLPPTPRPHYTTRPTFVPDPTPPNRGTAMPIHLTRRDFLKSSAALVAALTAAAWFPAPRAPPARTHTQPSCPQPQPSPPSPPPNWRPANPLPTSAPAGTAPCGPSTPWASPTSTIPSPPTWQPFGQGVDAVAVLNDEIYLFRGPDVAVYNQTTGQTAVQPIADQWPGLPPSFTSDLDGASVIDGVIHLYRSGRYVSTAAPGTAAAADLHRQLARSLARRRRLPAGAIVGQAPTYGLLFRTDLQPQVLLLDQSGGALTVAADGGADQPAALCRTGDGAQYPRRPFDAYIAANLAVDTQQATIFQGPILWTVNTNVAAGPLCPRHLCPRLVPRPAPGPARADRGPVERDDGRRRGLSRRHGLERGPGHRRRRRARRGCGRGRRALRPRHRRGRRPPSTSSTRRRWRGGRRWRWARSPRSSCPSATQAGSTCSATRRRGTVYHLANGAFAPVSTLPAGHRAL